MYSRVGNTLRVAKKRAPRSWGNHPDREHLRRMGATLSSEVHSLDLSFPAQFVAVYLLLGTAVCCLVLVMIQLLLG
jgi:hypothetical protein